MNHFEKLITSFIEEKNLVFLPRLTKNIRWYEFFPRGEWRAAVGHAAPRRAALLRVEAALKRSGALWCVEITPFVRSRPGWLETRDRGKGCQGSTTAFLLLHDMTAAHSTLLAKLISFWLTITWNRIHNFIDCIFHLWGCIFRRKTER